MTNTQVLYANSPSAIATAGGTTTSDTSWTMQAVNGTFPTANSGATPATVFHVADPNKPTELITVTNVSGATWTVTRGAEGTTAVAHQANATYYQVVSANDLAQMIQGAGNAQTINPGGLSITNGTTSSGGVLALTNTSSPSAGVCSVEMVGQAAGDTWMGIKVTGDSNNRWSVDTNGQTKWGSGSGSADVNLYRQGASVLATDDGFNLTINSTPGTPANGVSLGAPSGYLKYKSSDANAYSCGSIFMENIGSSQTISSTTGVAVTGYSCNVIIGTYIVDGMWFISNATAGTGSQQVNFEGGGSTATTPMRIVTTVYGDSTTAFKSATTVSTAQYIQGNGFQAFPGAQIGTSPGLMTIKGMITFSASGTFAITAKANSGVLTWTLNTGSWLSLTPTF